MEKNIEITICGITFSITEKGYSILDNYLKEIKNFYTEENEIVNDIENRIAELFVEKLVGQKKSITEEDVNEVINTLGHPADFDNENINSTENNTTTTKKVGNHRFYRNPDDCKIAGVLGGIAAYFNISSTVVRLVTTLLFLFSPLNSAIFVAYIILWAVTTKATTPAQKLEMYGQDVTIDNISKQTEKDKNTPQNNSNSGCLKALSIGCLGILALPILFIIFILICIFIGVGSDITSEIGKEITNNSIWFSWNGIEPSLLERICFYGCFILPIFAAIYGICCLISKKNISKTWIWITSAIIWIASVVGFISMSIKSIHNYQEFEIFDDSSYETYAPQCIDIDSFQRLEISNTIKAVLIQDSTSKIEFTTPINYTVKGGTLYLSKNNGNSIVLFQRNEDKTIVTIHTPNIEKINIDSGSGITCDNIINSKNLDIKADAGSVVDLEVEVENDLNIKGDSGSKIYIEGNSNNFNITADSGTSITLKGKCNNAKINADSGAYVDIRNLEVNNLNTNTDSGAYIKK